jgi:hypothetical protein
MNPILWKDCCLIAPKNNGLHSYDVHFSIVPSTGQVRIMNGECEVQSLKAREIENSWVGLVAVSFEHDKYISTWRLSSMASSRGCCGSVTEVGIAALP